ncbi:MAG: Rrf2 family transcriptional regulator [Gemmatimonadales bacterium]|nr:Rrf2 family transcriptional regulator [Gemmatimonadales bacterium]
MSTSPQFQFVASVGMLVSLARIRSGPLSSELLAQRHSLDGGEARRLLGRLRRAGLVHVTRGATGGVRLADRALSASLLDVAVALSGPRSPQREARAVRLAGRESHLAAPIVGVLHEARDRYEEALSAMTIGHLAELVEEGHREVIRARQARVWSLRSDQRRRRALSPAADDGAGGGEGAAAT